ncbi:tRNA 2-thiouridine(34) synthase TusD [Shewanella colwelliana]|uniref:tRNA 2-thiouridine(34) synthase TusD n=1 Tax=Shewanella colwelliana TaxID=23 RepID=A0A1E5IP59_SHECO|nr:sulfurtransferase complex subunit TusD [Shewanella colwelliana]OEG72276.1 tRNA 2-thiouridine(34) synthase TusD [Shewanella colwelliana]OEG75729.1 tRNA 2-thiouridine(34) synthase TusD [Shewanella colwelliana]
MSKILIQVNQPAYGKSSSYHALCYAKAAVTEGHQIVRVFFYQDGVLSTNSLNSPASDEYHLTQAWQAFAQTHHIPLINCVSAALRRGVLSPVEAKENRVAQWNLLPPFEMGGLGELVTGIEHADRVISF